MPRFRLTIEYAGTRYSGWQIQKNARTIQGEIDRAVRNHRKAVTFVEVIAHFGTRGEAPPARVHALRVGIDEMEIHTDAIGQGERVLLVDDLIATGGTAVAAVQLLRQVGADVIGACFVIDLPDLEGSAKLRELGVDVRTLVSFEGH